MKQTPLNNAWLTAQKLLIIGHRGASADAPENTLAAFRLAQAQGADGIEFDVQLSADGVPVVIHDDTLERTTNGIGLVGDYTAAQLAQLDAGHGDPVPTLAQVFAMCGRNFLYNVEIKTEGARAEGCVATVMDCIAQYDLAGQITLSSFDGETMRHVQRLRLPDLAIAMLNEPQDPAVPPFLQPDAVHPHFTMVSEPYMAWATAHNYRVHVWTVDDLEVAQILIDRGVNALITNQPQKLLAKS